MKSLIQHLFVPVQNEAFPLADACHSIKNEKFAVFQIN